jgi:hypothetical protein
LRTPDLAEYWLRHPIFGSTRLAAGHGRSRVARNLIEAVGGPYQDQLTVGAGFEIDVHSVSQLNF